MIRLMRCGCSTWRRWITTVSFVEGDAVGVGVAVTVTVTARFLILHCVCFALRVVVFVADGALVLVDDGAFVLEPALPDEGAASPESLVVAERLSTAGPGNWYFEPRTLKKLSPTRPGSVSLYAPGNETVLDGAPVPEPPTRICVQEG